MTGAAAYKVWQRAILATDGFRAQSRMGLPQGYERLSAAIEVMLALKLVLVESVSAHEDGALGVIARELHLLQKDLARDCEALKAELCARPSADFTGSPGEAEQHAIETHPQCGELKEKFGAWNGGPQ